MDNLTVDLLGWFGAAVLLFAYVGVSSGKLNPRAWPYQLLNLLGSVGLVANASWYGAYPSALVNVVWIAVAIVALGAVVWRARPARDPAGTGLAGMRYVHTNIIARDWKRLAAFYTDVFACRMRPPPRKQSGSWLSRGTGVGDAALEGAHLLLPGHGEQGPTLEIYTYAKNVDAAPVSPNTRGIGHLAFEVDDVGAVASKLADHGGSLGGEISESHVDGVGRITFVYARDPEGNLIELQSWQRDPCTS